MDRLDTRYLNELIPIMGAFVTAGAEVMGQINSRQTELQLAALFDPAQLTSAQDRNAAVIKLDELAALLDKTRSTYDAYILGLTARLVQALQKLPADRQTEYGQELMGKVQTLIKEQASFYQFRHAWIDATRRLLALFETHREAIWIEDGELVLASEALQSELNAITATIDGAAAAEAELLRTRAERIAALGPLFGITAQ